MWVPDVWVGSSASAALLRRTLTKASASRGPFLFVGEPGTGKALAARLVHGQAPGFGLFVGMCLAQMPSPLAEAELFGYARGAFTAVTGPGVGRVERARFGTLLLSDVENLTPAVQELLLRFLSTGEIRYAGSTDWFRLPPVRVIAASRLDLAQEVAGGRFSADLHARLAAQAIHFPALRERRDDILPIFRHYLHEFSRAIERPVPAISRYAAACLLANRWPGNARQVIRFAARSVIAGAIDVDRCGEPADRGWQELVELQWEDTVGTVSADPMTCGIYLTGEGLTLCMTRLPTGTVACEPVLDMRTGRKAAKQARRDFLYGAKRFEDLLAEDDRWK